MKVLVIDDDRDSAEALAEALELESIETAWHSDPVAALRIAREVRPDVILVDVLMPGMTGLEFMRAQHADREIASIPVVLMTALTAPLLASIEPCPPILFKPFEVDALLRAIRAALGAEREVEQIADRDA